MRRLAFAAAIVAALSLAVPAQASPATLEVRPGDVVELRVGPGGAAIPELVDPVRASRPGDITAFTLRDTSGVLVDGTALLALAGDEFSLPLGLPLQRPARLEPGRYLMVVSGHGTMALHFVLGQVRLATRKRSISAITPYAFHSQQRSLDRWEGEALPNDRAAFVIVFGGAIGSAKGYFASPCVHGASQETCEAAAQYGSCVDQYGDGLQSTFWRVTYETFNPGRLPARSTYAGELGTAFPLDTTFHGWTLVR